MPAGDRAGYDQQLAVATMPHRSCPLRIVGARALDGYVVRFRLSDGTFIERDFARVVASGPVFERMRDDRAVFRRVRVLGGGDGVAWPGRRGEGPLGVVDFSGDSVLWGRCPWMGGRRRPLKRALIGAGGLVEQREPPTSTAARRPGIAR